ncbi:Metallopeptidase family M24 [Trypanosoma brucei equiperdum]|uniref:Metallopeptidase family M24 n=1 Tax=Trypanosoma brucei equiperdum TaxID=630700 RepID=A0A3L6L1I8_9TRYP|nr:Metallopeptidase family M24 [Trypanosoma brucei equiperdum]
MGRGYSNSRSRSLRPTLRMKRNRSMSLQQKLHSVKSSSVTPVENKKPRPQTPVPRDNKDTQAEKRVTSTERKVSKSRTRSASTIRQRLVEMEKELVNHIEPDEAAAETIVKPDVMTKYKSGGRAVDEVIGLVIAACVPGTNTKQLCDLGDEELLQRVLGMFKKKDADGNRIIRGLSYPTNISVNHVLCNHAPLEESKATTLRGGDVVKIHMGCHIDGYPVSAARTIIVPFDVSSEGNTSDAGATNDGSSSRANSKSGSRPITQGVSNAIEAARVALHGVIHLLQPGNLNADITDFIHRVGNHYGVQALEGVLSNRTKRWVPDGMDCIITRRVVAEAPQQDVADCTIGANQVWTVDVAFTDHNSYKVRPSEDEETVIFRRTEVDLQTDFRVQSVQATLKEMTEKHQCFPFSLKHVENPLKARMAVAVLRKQGVIDPLPVMRVKGDRYITARFSATVAVSAKRATVLCGLPPLEPLAVPEEVMSATIPDDVALVLAEPLEFTQSEQPVRKKVRLEKGSKTTVGDANAPVEKRSGNEEDEGE